MRYSTSESFIRSAFMGLCEEPCLAENWYVSLIEETSYYGGPEEGGWWGSDSIVIAYQRFTHKEIADAVKERIDKLAQELSDQACKEFGEQCLRETEWLEARGLDDSFLPEPDGESKFRVTVSKGIPENYYGPRHYE